MWIALLGLAVTLAAGKVSMTANEAPLPEAMRALAAQLGCRLEMQGDFTDLRLTLRLENEEPAQAVRRILEGWPVDYYLRGRGEVIILHRRDRTGGTNTVYEPAPAPAALAAPGSAPVAVEVERALDFIGRLGQLNPEETKRLREELLRNW